MPKGTKVHKRYDAMVKGGMPKGKAAAVAQSATGQSLVTGEEPKAPPPPPAPPKKKGVSKKARYRAY